jgi:hypothetical protein
VHPQLTLAAQATQPGVAPTPAKRPAAQKRPPLTLRPVDRAELPWTEHFHALRDLASLLTVELDQLDQADDGRTPSDADRSASAQLLHHDPGSRPAMTAASGTLRAPTRYVA